MNWREARLTSVNVSDEWSGCASVPYGTGRDKFRQWRASMLLTRFEKVKVNTVLMRDVNHHQLDTFLARIWPRPIQLPS